MNPRKDVFRQPEAAALPAPASLGAKLAAALLPVRASRPAADNYEMSYSIPVEDFEIIKAVRGGDQEAYAELVRRYESRVRGLCVSMLLNVAEAEDVAQDVFIKVFTSLKSYRQDASFAAWIYRITSNHCLDVLRKKKRRKTDSLDGLTENNEDGAAMTEPRAASIEDPASTQNDERALAFRILSYLPADQRELLMLREVEGMRYDEIAAVLKCSVEAVRARLHRARRLLHEKARHFSEPDASTK